MIREHPPVTRYYRGLTINKTRNIINKLFYNLQLFGPADVGRYIDIPLIRESTAASYILHYKHSNVQVFSVNTKTI